MATYDDLNEMFKRLYSPMMTDVASSLSRPFHLVECQRRDPFAKQRATYTESVDGRGWEVYVTPDYSDVGYATTIDAAEAMVRLMEVPDV